MTDLSVIFAGSGEFGVPTLRALIDAGHQIVQVVSQPDKPAGRGRKLTPTPIASLALERELSLLRTGDINSERLADGDILIVIAFGQKISDNVVHRPRLGGINLHASRLPEFRGAAPIHAAILTGRTVTGNSVIRLAPKMDAGAVLGMSQLAIDPLETVGELHDRLAADGAPLILHVLEELASGRAIEVEQDHTKASLAPRLSRESARIEWNRPAALVARQIRAMHPWPACHVRLLDESSQELSRATLVRARAAPAQEALLVGRIGPGGHIAAEAGSVEIIELQPEGGRPMPLSAFRNGHSWKPGMCVESI